MYGGIQGKSFGTCYTQPQAVLKPFPVFEDDFAHPLHRNAVKEIFDELSYDSKGNRRLAPPTDDRSVAMAERAISLTCSSSKDAKYFNAVRTLVTILAARYERTEDPQDLNRAIRTAEKHAILTRHWSSHDIGTMWSVHEMTAELYAWRFHLNGDRKDIDLAISHMHAAEQLMRNRWVVTEDDSYALMLYNFGVILYEKFCTTGGRQDLDRAIGKTMRAVRCSGVSSPDRASFLASLGRMLRDRFDSGGNLKDLEMAIERTQEAIGLFVGLPLDDEEGLQSCLTSLADMDRQRSVIQSSWNGAKTVCNSYPDSPDNTPIPIAPSRVPLTCSSSDKIGRFAISKTIRPQAPSDLSLAECSQSTIGSSRRSTAPLDALPSAKRALDTKQGGVPSGLLFSLDQISFLAWITVDLSNTFKSFSPYTSRALPPSIQHAVVAKHLDSSSELSDRGSPTGSIEADGDEEPELCDSPTIDSDTDFTGSDHYQEAQPMEMCFTRSGILQVGSRATGGAALNERPACQSSSTSGTVTASSTSKLVSSSSKRASTRKTLDRIPRRPNSEDNSDEEEEDDRPKKRTRTDVQSNSSRRLKCPYYQRRPEEYSDHACRGQGFDGMAKLKDHLKRKHLKPLKCKRCWQEMRTEDDLTYHLQEDTICAKFPEPRDDRVYLSTLQSLNFNSSPFAQANSVEEKWKMLYKKLFPDDTVVPSAFELPGVNTYTEHRFLTIFEEEASKEFDDPHLRHLLTKLNDVMIRTRERLHHDLDHVSQPGSLDTSPSQGKLSSEGSPYIEQLDPPMPGSLVFDRDLTGSTSIRHLLPDSSRVMGNHNTINYSATPYPQDFGKTTLHSSGPFVVGGTEFANLPNFPITEQPHMEFDPWSGWDIHPSLSGLPHG